MNERWFLKPFPKMRTAPAADPNDVNYSAAATVIHFDRPIPVLRGPILAGPTDDPSLSPQFLAFRNPQSFFSACRFCRSKLLKQCDAGVRIGCFIAASGKCASPWWILLLGGGTNFKEREIANRLDESKGKCEKLFEEKSSSVFGSARVARRGRWRVGKKEAAEFVEWISLLRQQKKKVSQLGFFLGSKSLVHQVTNCSGTELLNIIHISNWVIS